MLIAEVAEAQGFLICWECGIFDGTVAPCDWCHKCVCIEHDDVLMNRDIDSDLMLCQPCGDEYDKKVSNGEPV